jgi:hypothetical protein
MDGAQAACRNLPGILFPFADGYTRFRVGVRGGSCEAFGVSLGGASSSADLGCSSEYSIADNTVSDGSLKAEVGKVSKSTLLGFGSLGTEPNVKP